MRLDAISRTEDGRMKVRTPPAPQTGKTSMELDPLELIHRICAQIPAPGQHPVRYYGWYGNRARGARKEHGVGVIDGILRHLWHVGGNDPWEGTTLRGPPGKSVRGG
jgi:hypothetical protein